uniref:Mannosyltransferase n=1 Tax=Rhizophora mucronata TaxID=61149 RepID=A0A2P2JK38_RHIMU
MSIERTRRKSEVIIPVTNVSLNFLVREYNVTGRKAKIENGQPRTTPRTATKTAKAGFSRRNNPDERLIAYIENELGKKLVLAKKQPLVRHSIASA